MGKVMRHTLGASLNIRHNLSSSKGPKPLQLKLLTTYIPKTSAFTLAFSTSQRLRTTRASARTFFTFRHYITPSADRKSGSAGMPRPISYAVFCLKKKKATKALAYLLVVELATAPEREARFEDDETRQRRETNGDPADQI